MKITREKIFVLREVFDRLSKEKANTFFHYALKKNKQLIGNELQILDDLKNISNEKAIEYDNKRIKKCEELCLRDENNELIILDAQENRILSSNKNVPGAHYAFSEEAIVKINEEVELLKEEYKEALEESELNKKQFISLLSEEVEIDLHKFKLNSLPQEIMGTDMELLFDLIEED